MRKQETHTEIPFPFFNTYQQTNDKQEGDTLTSSYVTNKFKTFINPCKQI